MCTTASLVPAGKRDRLGDAVMSCGRERIRDKGGKKKVCGKQAKALQQTQIDLTTVPAALPGLEVP